MDLIYCLILSFIVGHVPEFRCIDGLEVLVVEVNDRSKIVFQMLYF